LRRDEPLDTVGNVTCREPLQNAGRESFEERNDVSR
jgi:hypothetical protein